MGLTRVDVEKYIGTKWGRLTIIKEVRPRIRKGEWGKGEYRPTRCQCKCDCGKKTSVDIASLFSGGTKSCGCAQFSGKGRSPKYEYSTMVDDWVYKHLRRM